MGSRLLVESPTSMTLLASCMFPPLFEQCARKLFRSFPKFRRRGLVSRLRHDQRLCRRAPKLADAAGTIIGARLGVGARRREQDRSRAVFGGLTEKRRGEAGGKRDETARTARKQVRSGEPGMCGVADEPPPFPIASSLKFEREHEAGELRLPVCLPWRVESFALQIA